MNREGRGNLSGGTRAKIKLNPLNMLGGQMMASAADKAVAGAKAQNIIDQSDWNANGDLNKSTQPTDRAGITPPKNTAPQFTSPNLGKAPGWWQNLLTQGGAGSMYAQAQYGGLQAQADAQNRWAGESAMENLRNQHEAEAAALKNKHEIELAILNQTGDVRKTLGIPLGPEGDAMFSGIIQNINNRNIAKLDAETATNNNITKAARHTYGVMDEQGWKTANTEGEIALARKPATDANVALRTADAAYGNMLANKGANQLGLMRLQYEQNKPLDLAFGAKLVSQDGTVLADNPRPEDYHTQLLKGLGQGATTPGINYNQLPQGHFQVGNSFLVPKNQAAPAQRTAPAPTPVTPPRNSFLPERGMDRGYIPTGAVAELAPQGVIDANRALSQPTPLGDPVKKLLKYLGQVSYGIVNDEARKQLDRTQIWNPTWGQ